MHLARLSLWGGRPFLEEQRLTAVLLPSVAACLLWVGRFLRTGSDDFRSMLWNLLLAWIPYACSFAAAVLQRSRHPHRRMLVAVTGAAWLAFLPNAPYLVTDLFRLRSPTPVPVFYDVSMLAMFAWSGCILGAASLHAMRRIVEHVAGPVAGHVAALVVIGLTGLGMYLGRVVRLNSWDLALRPGRVLTHAACAVHSRDGVLLTLLFSGFFFVCYVTMSAPRPSADPTTRRLAPGSPQRAIASRPT